MLWGAIGATLVPCRAQSCVENLFYHGWEPDSVRDNIEKCDYVWATPNVSAVPVRAGASHSSEMISQALMGHPLKVNGVRGEWVRTTGPDGYHGWINLSSLAFMDSISMECWKSAPRLAIVSQSTVKAYSANSPDKIVCDLVDGDIVEGEQTDSAYIAITLPDGRKALIASGCVMEISRWASQTFDGEKVVEFARSMTGVPYMWGANTVKEADCSGLVKAACLNRGIIMPRDASQQAMTGERVGASQSSILQCGDFLFFGNGSSDGKVTHVGFYDGNGRIVHSSGMVRENDLAANAPEPLGRELMFGVRITGNAGTPGIIKIIAHPWYFPQP